jgi:pimeloyl-ACP methyl ester carboxylesterase
MFVRLFAGRGISPNPSVGETSRSRRLKAKRLPLNRFEKKIVRFIHGPNAHPELTEGVQHLAKNVRVAAASCFGATATSTGMSRTSPVLTRFTAALNWYRASVAPQAEAPAFGDLPRVQAPTLGVWSMGDNHLVEAGMTRSAEQVAGPWRYERVEGAGHWIPLDAPDRLNGLLREFLRGASDRAPRRRYSRCGHRRRCACDGTRPRWSGRARLERQTVYRRGAEAGASVVRGVGESLFPRFCAGDCV